MRNIRAEGYEGPDRRQAEWLGHWRQMIGAGVVALAAAGISTYTTVQVMSGQLVEIKDTQRRTEDTLRGQQTLIGDIKTSLAEHNVRLDRDDRDISAIQAQFATISSSIQDVENKITALDRGLDDFLKERPKR